MYPVHAREYMTKKKKTMYNSERKQCGLCRADSNETYIQYDTMRRANVMKAGWTGHCLGASAFAGCSGSGDTSHGGGSR